MTHCTSVDINFAHLSVWLAGVLPPLVSVRGLIASDRELPNAALLPLSLPKPAEAGDYFLHHRMV